MLPTALKPGQKQNDKMMDFYKRQALNIMENPEAILYEERLPQVMMMYTPHFGHDFEKKEQELGLQNIVKGRHSRITNLQQL